ncbi:MAG: Glu-tRNA(Gln) amidotransferase subunit GatE [Nitrososphaerota archaeon]|nr:Glu-tRNA(Gln) amidotransferase subunit GatE [Candidatus Calditenuaceae archaeon]MDW8073917.1 Glu-tRNA(Gln) amidotransferase subunit GatE [Nitrososphaerota archaeon]
MSYEELGLKVGLEIHRQLDTKHKLFCSCGTTPPPEGRAKIRVMRRLRETQSELGEVDQAARFESLRMRRIIYEYDPSSACLVELDEEPPHPINLEAVRIALTAALMVGGRPVDEIHVMRKIVIDGSNTSGFQRTCIVSLGGELVVDGLRVPIQTITLEEDAARIVRAEADEVVYDLSRLGIPLIEVSTGPVLNSPTLAAKAAEAIGRVLRATRGVKRGLGTVRQDLNISIRGSGLMEVKGVQELELIPKVIDYEVRRLKHLASLVEELKRRGVQPEAVESQPILDLTSVFEGCESRLIKRKISEGGLVLGLRLPGFAGLLRGEGDVRLGRELAEYAKAWGGVEGIFHSDELPGYGIGRSEVDEARRVLGCGEGDGFVVVAGREARARDALEAVRMRAAQACALIPDETRAALPDGTTIYMRPRPGSARMYPETDIPPFRVSRELLEEIERSLPPPLERVAEELVKRYRLSNQLAWELIDSEMVEEFEAIVGLGVAPSVVASTLTEGLKQLRREGHRVENITPQHIRDYFKLVSRGETAKESALQVLAEIAKDPALAAEEAVDRLGLRAPPIEEVKAYIDELVSHVPPNERKSATGKLMGELMRKYRGRVDGALLNKLLMERVKAN